MSTRNKNTELRRHAIAIDIWQNEGGAFASDTPDDEYGRRIEGDRSWTVYHVYTGVPACIGGRALTGLSRLQATGSMLSLNEHNSVRRKGRRLAILGVKPLNAEGPR